METLLNGLMFTIVALFAIPVIGLVAVFFERKAGIR